MGVSPRVSASVALINPRARSRPTTQPTNWMMRRMNWLLNGIAMMPSAMLTPQITNTMPIIGPMFFQYAFQP